MKYKDLIQIMKYDEVTGYVYFKKCLDRWGHTAFLRHTKKTIGINGKTYQTARLVWLYVNQEYPKSKIVFLNGQADFRLSNLIESTSFKEIPLTQDNLKKFIKYDPITGKVIRLQLCNSNEIIGEELGTLVDDGTTNKGYLVVSIFGKRLPLHRIIYLYMLGKLPDGQIDHINGIRTDNRWINLRVTSGNENMLNKRIYSNNKSGYHGIHKLNNKFRVRIKYNNTNYYLGSFKTFKEAYKARNSVERCFNFHKNHGFKCRTTIPIGSRA